MKIAISSTGNTLDSAVDPLFGRCRYFLFVDGDTMEFEAVENKSANSVGGAGIAAAQTVAAKQPDAVVTGNVGPNAMDVLKEAKIRVHVGFEGSAREAAEACQAGKLIATSKPSVDGHHGK